MDPALQPAPPADRLTPSQRAAVTARGNVLVMAGAGTGKTHTLIQRCLACLNEDAAAIDEILVVTFTEAAAAEMRARLRRALEDAARARPGDPRRLEQLALFETAHIGTLHSFCFRLVREHFHELGLDPDLAIIESAEAHWRAEQTLEDELQRHYAGTTPFDLAVQELIQVHGGGRDESIRALVLQLHHYAQTRPDTAGWLTRQLAAFAAPEPHVWRAWLLDALTQWHAEWLPALAELRADNSKAQELLDLFQALPANFTRAQAADLLEKIIAASNVWPPKKKGLLEKPLKPLFADAAFLHSLARQPDGRDPLAEDWAWTRGHLTTLLQLAQNFSARFTADKTHAGLVDFHDLEQFALRLLWDFAADAPTPVARRWRERLRFVLADEYQDINAAQDRIIQALSRDDDRANRFLVGDVKQSIYRFRLADPRIFRDYAARWRPPAGQTLALAENFRSREALLNFVNSVFTPLMRAEIGGVVYDDDARLRFGAPAARAPLAAAPGTPPRTELLLFQTASRAEPDEPAPDNDGPGGLLGELDNTEKEARLLAARLRELKNAGHEIWDDELKTFRPAAWRDMAVLLRAPGRRAEVYAREFDRAGIPLVVERGGFYESAEIADLLGLLQLLDNPLQDIPAIGVLRSPLVGLTLADLAHVRLAAPREPFWTALNRSRDLPGTLPAAAHEKVAAFLDRFARWRTLARQAPLAPCLEAVLTETLYLEWLTSRPRGAQRQANVRRFLAFAEQFDQFQQQGLHRFLKFITVQREAGGDPEVVPVLAEDAVRLISIHQSKGLEFPVVAVADLARGFNTQELRADIIFDETLGLCACVKPPGSGGRYPSLPHWLARRLRKREQAGEELRLLYVALTRARDTLLLTGHVTEKKWTERWTIPAPVTPQKILAAASFADWLGLWFAAQFNETPGPVGELPHLRWQLIQESQIPAPPAVTAANAAAEPPVLTPELRHRLQTALTWQYPFDAATQYPAKTSVTALRRQADENLPAETAPFLPDTAAERAERRRPPAGLSAADVGTAHHTFLQHVRLDQTTSLAALTAEAARLTEERHLTLKTAQALDLAAIADFWTTPLGREILTHAAAVRRELTFTARFTPQELTDLSGLKASPDDPPQPAGEFAVVQGVVDLAVLLPAEIWIVDFKTDTLAPGDLAAKTAHYRPQLNLYAAALANTYHRPVTRRHLHFLTPHQTIPI